MIGQMIGQKKNNAQSKYVPPNRRANQQRNPRLSKQQSSFIDTQNVSEFPALGSDTNKRNAERESALNYAGATREEEQLTESNANAVAPGWVRVKLCRDTATDAAVMGNYIRKEYGEGAKVLIEDTSSQDEQSAAAPLNWGLTAGQSKELTKLVKRWQTDRDIMNDHLDQASPHWGAKHVDDPLSDDDLESEAGSYLSDDEDNNDGMGENGDY
jgi:hypothetical protein